MVPCSCVSRLGAGGDVASDAPDRFAYWHIMKMKDRNQETFEPVTLGHIRGLGVRHLLVYCDSIACNHQTTMNADHLPDETVIRPLGRRMVCTRCGHRGADVRPDWSQHMPTAGPGGAHRR
jgi:hypothetical protein